jgi:[acyl-carrier-protein] S-malonyltransferase
MGRDLCSAHPTARDCFALADEILGYALSKVCFEGPEDELTRTNRAQSAIYVSSVASALVALKDGVIARESILAAAGLSLGEYTALWFAGAFPFEVGLKLVQLRGDAMQAASDQVPSGMLALLGANEAQAEDTCNQAREDGVLVVANLNSPGQVIVSGDAKALSRVPEVAKGFGIRKCIPLKVAGAFHSPLMEPARTALKAGLDAVAIADTCVPVYSNVLARPTKSGAQIKQLLADQLVSPVLWEASLRAMVKDGFVSFVEPQPGTTLAGMMKKIHPEVPVQALP